MARVDVERVTVVTEVAENLEAMFSKFRKWAHLQEPTKPEDRARIEQEIRAREDWAIQQGFMKRNADGTITVLNQGMALLAKKEEEDSMEQVRETREINTSISEELNRINPQTVQITKETAAEFYNLLDVIAVGYGKEGFRRNAQAILRYLETCIDHYFWLYRQFLAACLAMGDFESAESLLEAIQDHPQFANAKGVHATLYVGKSLIYANRDKDLKKALEWAGYARDRCGADRIAVKYWKQCVEAVKRFPALAQGYDGEQLALGEGGQEKGRNVRKPIPKKVIDSLFG